MNKRRPIPRDLWRGIRRLLGAAGAGPFELVFPRICVMCGQPIDDGSETCDFCETCQPGLQPFETNTCPRCASPCPAGLRYVDRCPFCRHRRYAFREAVAWGVYKGWLREAVIRAKQSAYEPLAAALGRRLAIACEKRWGGTQVDVVIPMPMHWSRRWLRGTNGVELMALAVARASRTPCHTGWLHFRRVTSKQGLLSPAERFANVRRSMYASRRARLRGKTVLLIDDVMTTGATASEAARALRAAGASRVLVAVVARGTGR